MSGSFAPTGAPITFSTAAATIRLPAAAASSRVAPEGRRTPSVRPRLFSYPAGCALAPPASAQGLTLVYVSAQPELCFRH
jgi:hypothetical protein